jgi:adenine-specific DNA-methyltransferase
VALVDELLKQVKDESLRTVLAREVQSLRERITFGLVFEKHIPETAVVTGAPIRVGSIVQRRDLPEDPTEYLVHALNGRSAQVRSLEESDGGPPEKIPLKLLASVKQFGDPVYPGLRSLEKIERSADRAFHAVINGENYHALQLLAVFGESTVDCVYLDPPYNTGAQDWKYNNRFVDKSDGWRHSKWLSFMERRLQVAKLLLKPEGVLVISVDENEHGHLTCLLEDLFAGWEITSVTIVHNPRGIQGDNFSHTNDFAVFVTPPGVKAIAKRPVEADAQQETRFRVWGDQSERKTAKNCFFPIYVQDEGVVGFGEVPANDFHPQSAVIEQGSGRCEVWPVDNNGIERKWRNQRKTIEQVAHLLRPEWINGQLQIRIDKDTAMHKTVWTGSRYDAGSHGKRLLNKVLGVDFDYPKSLYTMRDILYACTGDRKDAVILDYFAGSGTTLHATCLLNAEDGGRRRCILVTNNEVEAKTAVKLNKRGLYSGDAGFEQHGIFQAVAKPRCERSITGAGAAGEPLPGEYEGGRARSLGFEENIEFFDLVYLDPDEVELGRSFSDIHPLLWLSAGAAHSRANVDPRSEYAIDSTYAVLFDDARMRLFEEALAGRLGVTHIFHATNAPDAFAELVGLVGIERFSRMLYRDYLSACRTNARIA